MTELELKEEVRYHAESLMEHSLLENQKTTTRAYIFSCLLALGMTGGLLSDAESIRNGEFPFPFFSGMALSALIMAKRWQNEGMKSDEQLKALAHVDTESFRAAMLETGWQNDIPGFVIPGDEVPVVLEEPKLVSPLENVPVFEDTEHIFYETIFRISRDALDVSQASAGLSHGGSVYSYRPV